MQRPYRDTSKPPKSTGSTPFSLLKSDRFGDEPLKRPPRVRPVYGGVAPSHIEHGFRHRPEDIGRVGTSSTPVESWKFATVEHHTKKPEEHAYWDDLGPGRYTPDKLVPIGGSGRLAPSEPKWSIGGESKRMTAPRSSADLMYTLPATIGPQHTSGLRTATSSSFGRILEPRMELQKYASREADRKSDDALSRSKRGLAVTAEEREAIRQSRRGLREDGVHTAEIYVPKSAFDRALQPSRSASYSFGRVNSSSRFATGEKSAKEKAAERAEKAAPPPHGGKMGGAFRKDPPTLPGPDQYLTDEGFGGTTGSGFDGTGRLKMSRSSPAITLTGLVPLSQLTGREQAAPDSGTYFKTEPFRRPGGS